MRARSSRRGSLLCAGRTSARRLCLMQRRRRRSELRTLGVDNGVNQFVVGEGLENDVGTHARGQGGRELEAYPTSGSGRHLEVGSIR